MIKNYFVPDSSNFSDQILLDSLLVRFDSMEECIQYFFWGERKTKWLFDYRKKKLEQIDPSILEHANLLCNGMQFNHWAPDKPVKLYEGHFVKGWDGKVNSSSYFSIFRGIFASELGLAYAHTRNPIYAVMINKLIPAWIEDFPFQLDADYNPDEAGWFQKFTCEHMNEGIRCKYWIDAYYSGILHASEVTDSTRRLFIRSLWQGISQFTRFRRGSVYHRGNHHLFEQGVIPFMLGISFPEFACSRDLIEKGMFVIKEHIKKGVFDDGGYEEHSSFYVASVASMFFMLPFLLAKRNRMELYDKEEMEKLKKFATGIANLVMPSGVVPGIGDGPEMNMWYELMILGCALGVPEAYHIAVKFKRDDWGLKWYNLGFLGSYPDEFFPAPGEGSLQERFIWEFGGYTVLRNKDRDTMIISHKHNMADPYGHSHFDHGSVIIAVKGNTIINELAGWLYPHHMVVDSSLYEYAKIPRSHNMVVVDNFMEGTYKDRPINGVDFIRTDCVDSAIEKIEIQHSMYGFCKIKRTIYYANRSVWLIVDEVFDIFDEGEHLFEQFFHFDYDVVAELKNAEVVACKGNSCIKLRWPDEARNEISLIPDNLMKGCFYGISRNAPLMCYRAKRGTAPVVLPVLLAPLRERTEVVLNCRQKSCASEWEFEFGSPERLFSLIHYRK